MSEFIEPPPKQINIEDTEAMEQTAAEPQEEWLSEGLLTDDDLPLMDQDRSTEDLANDSMNTNQEDSAIQSMLDSKPTSESVSNDDIENYLKPIIIQTTQADDVASKMKAKIEELDEFLIKNDGVNEEKVDKKPDDDVKDRTSDLDHSSRNGNDDDGNNTDDLLRMLGDDSCKVKVKKLLKTVNRKPSVDSDGDSYDEDMFENAEIKTFRMTKNVIMRKKNFTKVRPKTTNSSHSPKTNDVSTPSRQVATKTGVVKKIVNIPIKCVVKTGPKEEKEIPKYIKCGPPIRARNLNDSKMVDSTDEENEAEFLDDDFFDLDDNMDGPVEMSGDEVIGRQPTQPQILRRPEQMDEEVPSDVDTDDSNVSFYNELPSSESEDIGEWFSVDIRGERAADYLPMLGDRAEKLLTDEKENMSQRLAMLRKNLDDLKNSSAVLISKVVNNRDTLNGLNNMMKDYTVKNCEENSS